MQQAVAALAGYCRRTIVVQDGQRGQIGWAIHSTHNVVVAVAVAVAVVVVVVVVVLVLVLVLVLVIVLGLVLVLVVLVVLVVVTVADLEFLDFGKLSNLEM